MSLIDEKVKSNTEFDIFQMFQGLTCDVIGECALAMKVQHLSDLLKFSGFTQSKHLLRNRRAWLDT